MATRARRRACGLIIFRRLPHSSRVEYLLLQTRNNPDNWAPPKGHVKGNETDEVTALRETREETGINRQSLQIINHFSPVELQYEANGRPKTVIYGLAKLTDPNFKVKLSTEHAAFEWADFEKAHGLLWRYEDLLDELKRADDYIKENNL